jgi:tRNA U55 pseudouridine synthase TruB
MDTHGVVSHEQDSEQPLELKLTCRAPRFLNFAGANADVEQLAPALGLRKMYGLGTRHFPLYVATPLVETTTFRVHLPPGMLVRTLPRDFQASNDFGAYSVTFRQTGPGEFQVRRAFSFAVQVIAPDRYTGFAQMARQIDDAERQRLTLERTSSLRPSKSGAN